MSKNHLLTLVFVILFGGLSAQSTTSNKPSDASSGYTYDFDKITELVHKEIKAQSSQPKDIEVQQLINSPGFPKVDNKSAITIAEKTAISNWIQENGNLVIKLFINRKDIVTPF